MLLALLTLLVTPSFSGVAVDAESHAARVERLREDVHRAMLALYMENAEARVHHVPAASPAAAGSVIHEVPVLSQGLIHAGSELHQGVEHVAAASPAAAGPASHEVPNVQASDSTATPSATIAAEPERGEEDPAEHQAPAPSLRGMPFGQLETFGREDTAQELTDSSIEESNKMIDQVERAVVAETKRSMFRALTRLRGVTVSSYDGMANAQAGNIDNYARQNKWTKTHKIHHLAEKEGDVEHWAFSSAEPVD